jgi:glyoxylase-like metal-dependent hydrolase (beta-lactamase superfamily II)
MLPPPAPLASRRQFLTTSAAALAAAAAPRALYSAEPPSVPVVPPLPPARNAFAYRFAIGDIEAWSISDANMALKEGLGLMLPESERPAMRADLVARGERTDVLPLYVNILVAKLGTEIAIFDAGFGPRKDHNGGWTAAALASIGIAPEKITHAFLSHAHADHINGFVSGNKPAFPNAALHCLRDELDFWRSPEPDFSRTRRARGPLPGMIRDNRAKFDILQPNLQLHRDGDSLLGGAISFVPGRGHTVGHSLFRLRSGTESLLHFMDAAHHHTLMFTNPSWAINYDHEPEQAVDTRKKLFAELSTTHERAYGFHLPWPGLGRVARTAPGYTWQPERWSWGI